MTDPTIIDIVPGSRPPGRVCEGPGGAYSTFCPGWCTCWCW